MVWYLGLIYVSPKDLGAKYIIIGHSERRTYHKESDEFVAKKFGALKEAGGHIAAKSQAVADQVIIQYGGSVNDVNAVEFIDNSLHQIIPYYINYLLSTVK